MTTVVIVIVVVIVVVAFGVVVAGRRRSKDGVDSFRRQIDALSPEARRPVVDQVQSVAESQEPPVVEPPVTERGAEPVVDPDPDEPAGDDT